MMFINHNSTSYEYPNIQTKFPIQRISLPNNISTYSLNENLWCKILI